MGYIQYIAEPEPEFRVVDHAANEGVVDFKVTIEEGQLFRIRSIKFEGSNVSEKELRSVAHPRWRCFQPTALRKECQSIERDELV